MNLISFRRLILPACLLLLALAAGCTLPGHLPLLAHAVGAPLASAEETPADESAPAQTGAPTAFARSLARQSGESGATPAASTILTATAPSIAAVPLPTATAYVTSTFLTPQTGTATGATGSAAVPFTTPDGLARTVRVPILMYHYVSQPGPDADIYRKDLSVPPDRFESHLAYLRDNGFHVISLDDLRGAMVQGKTLPDKPVVLTFDDGYEDNYTNAFPLLKKYGMTAYFFILTDVTTEGRAGYMSWAEIEEMSKAGQHIGAHGRNHQQAFRGKTRDFLVWHALGTSEAIQQHLGYHPRWVAYPSGAYDDLTMEVFHSAGFVGGLSTEPGATHRPDTLFHLSRVRVHGNYSAEELGRLLNYN